MGYGVFYEKFVKTWMIIGTLSHWYSFESAQRELSYEYQCGRFPMIIQLLRKKFQIHEAGEPSEEEGGLVIDEETTKVGPMVFLQKKMFNL